MSVRQVRRLLAAHRRESAATLRHGNQGRQPAHTISAEMRQRVLALARSTYYDCNPQHLSELLAEREGLALSRSSLRRILLEVGLYRPRPRAAAPHRQRRARYARAGMLVQIDASPHDWLQGHGPRLALVAAIDDATNRIPAALFRPTEDAHGYFLLLQQFVAAHGRPLALYQDRHSVFQHNPKRPWSPAEQLAGRPEPTQFGRLLAELEIASIAARSPQAKGRIERLFGTLQERLVVELRLAGAGTLAEADAVLAAFLPKHNRRFRVPAAEAGSAYRPWTLPCRPDEIFCFKYQRVVAADNIVRLGEHRRQLLPTRQRASWARDRRGPRAAGRGPGRVPPGRLPRHAASPAGGARPACPRPPPPRPALRSRARPRRARRPASRRRITPGGAAAASPRG